MRPVLRPLVVLVAALASCAADPDPADTSPATGEVAVQGWPAGIPGEVRMWRNAMVDNVVGGPFAVDSAGRFRYALGAPAHLMPFSAADGVTVDPADARWQAVAVMPTRLAGEESEATGEVRLGSGFWKVPLEPGQTVAQLWYVDRDVSVTGTAPDGCTFAQHFRAGWNFAIRRSQAAPPSCTHTAATALPPDLGWHYEYLGP
jgi:hypothetical protein